MVCDVENVGEGHLCHRHGAVGGDVGNHHALACCRLGVDDVVACGKHADEAKSWQLSQRVGAERHFVGQHDIGVGCALHDFVGWCAVEKRHVAQTLNGRPIKVARVEGISV